MITIKRGFWIIFKKFVGCDIIYTIDNNTGLTIIKGDKMNIKLLVKKMDELVDSSDIKIINDIDNISLNCISDQKNTLSIMEYDKNIMCPKNSNILFLKAEDEIIENENANIIYSKNQRIVE